VKPRTRNWLHLLILGIILLTAVVYRLALAPHVLDDAYITFRYARNLASGLGFVYNTGERVLGTTTPLFTLLLAGGLKLGLAPSVMALVVNALADSASILLLYLVCRRLHIPVVGLIAALILAISPQFVTYSISGLETSFYIAILLSAWALYVFGHVLPAFVMAGVAGIVRPDALLMAMALYADRLLGTRRVELRLILVALLAAAPWLVFATFYFGSPIPNSVTTKAGESWLTDGSFQSTGILAAYFLRPTNGVAGNDKNLLFTLLFAIGSIPIVGSTWRRFHSGKTHSTPPRSYLLPLEQLHGLFSLLLWAMLYVLAFSLSDAFALAPWYFIPLYPAYFAVALVGLGWLADRLLPNVLARVRMADWGELILFPLLLVILALLPSRLRVQQAHLNDWIAQREGAYRHAAEFVAVHSDPSDRIGANEIGAIGYYSSHYIVDLAGLVTLRPRGEGVIETLWRHRPQWLIVGESWLTADQAQAPSLEVLYERVWRVPDTGVSVFRIRK
jgi:hypothetical protein